MNKWTLGQVGKTKPIQTQFKPKQRQFYIAPAAKKFHLILVFGWTVVFNSHFNVKIEPLSHNILRSLEIFGSRKGSLGSPTELR
jgi:hypothetical protein